jgi:general secretion pathway protein L
VKIVGLKIEKGRVAAAVVDKGFRKTELIDSFSLSFATDAELVSILKEKARDWTGARIVSSIPGSHFSQRTLHFPFSDRKRLEKALPFEVEDIVPFPLEDVVLDHLALQDGKPEKGSVARKETPVLGMMLPKALLRLHLDLLAGAGVDPQVIVPSYAGLYSVAKMMKVEGRALLVSGDDLCLMLDGTVRGVRSYSGTAATGGLRHVLQVLETEQGARIEKVVILSADETVRKTATELGIPVEDVAPELGGKKAADPVGLGLALSGDVNFRKGEFAYRLADQGTRKMRRTVIAAGAAAAVLFGINLGVKLYIVQAGYGRLDKEIKDIYRHTFPDAKTVADPLRQMRAGLDETAKKIGVLGTGTSVLDIMKAVTDGIPKEVRVSFTEFNLEGERLKLQGEASSFETMDRIKAELLKTQVFSEVVVQDTRMGVENKVKFRMELKLKQAI